MKIKTSYIYLFFCFVFILIVISCNSKTDSRDSNISEINTDTITAIRESVSQPNFTGQEMQVKTFEVIDSISKKSMGWGYDIYIDGKKGIHQPIIPAIPGNNSFSSVEKANKAGLFAVNKMQKTGSLPTLSVAELDSLGVTK